MNGDITDPTKLTADMVIEVARRQIGLNERGTPVVEMAEGVGWVVTFRTVVDLDCVVKEACR